MPRIVHLATVAFPSVSPAAARADPIALARARQALSIAKRTIGNGANVSAGEVANRYAITVNANVT